MRPSAGIGVVEVQKLVFFLRFLIFPCDFRVTLCGDRRGRGAKTRGFLRLLIFPRDPLRGSAWSRCQNLRFWRFFAVPARPSAEIGVVEVQHSFFFWSVSAQPSAEIGVVEVQKLEVFCVFDIPG